MSQTPAKSARSPQTPAGIFTITSSTGKVCDLTSLILDGAKLTMLFSQLCYSWGISYNLKRAEYHQLREPVKRGNPPDSSPTKPKPTTPASSA